MLKNEFIKEVKNSKATPRPRQPYIGLEVTAEEKESFRAAAEECGCSMSEYIRRLHKYIQEK